MPVWHARCALDNPGAAHEAADHRAAAEARSDKSAEFATLGDDAARAEDDAEHSRSAAAIQTDASDWRDFLDFCEQREALPLPADEQTVAAYPAALADGGAKSATIARRLVVIARPTSSPTCLRRPPRNWCGAHMPASAAASPPPNSARRRPWSTTSS